MEETLILQQRIAKYLNGFYDSLEMQSSTGDYSLNKAAENIFRNVLNSLYDYNLENVNLEISNYPAIDLIGINSRVCYQVTFTNSIEKVKDTLDKFFSKKLHLQFDTINFIILKSARNYSKATFKINYLKIIQNHGVSNFQFDIKKNIIDSSYMYNLILNLTNSSKLIEISEMLGEYNTGVKAQTNLSQYYEALKNEFYEVVMEDPSGMTLSDIYIEPNFQYYKPQILENCYDVKDHEDFVDVNFNTKDIIASFLNSETSTLHGIFKKPESSVLFVLGYPGQGKTSFCKKIIHEHLSGVRDTPIFYLKLRNVRNTRALIDNPLAIIQEELQIEVDDDLPKKLLKKSIIILDGLDELYMKDNLKSEDIERFSKELIRDCERLKYHKIIITSRYGYVDLKRIYETQYLALSLKPLSLQQQLQWMAKYEIFHPKTILTEDKIRSFNDKSSKIGFVKELINQPLLLYIIASLNVELDADTDRAQIYDLLFDQIIDRRYSKDGQIDTLKNLTKDDLRALLHEIAYLIFTSGNEYITEKELLVDPVVKEYIQKIGGKNLSGTLKGVLISFYFKESKRKDLADKSNTGIEFLHKSLQEFLAAEKIIESCFNDLLNKDSREKYVLKSENDILNWFNNLFGKQLLSGEIIGFILIMIAKKSRELRKELSDRLEESFIYFLDKDFLFEYSISDKRAFDKILTLFESFWLIITSLNQRKNYLTTAKITKKVVDYMNTVSTISKYNYGVNISYQTFENCRATFLSSVAENKVVNARFQSVHFYNDNVFMFKEIESCNFIYCNGYRLSFLETKVIDCKFEYCEFNSSEFLNVIFKNVIFKSCQIFRLEVFNQEGLKSKNLLFNNVVFDKISFDMLKEKYPKAKFRHCRIKVKEDEYLEV